MKKILLALTLTLALLASACDSSTSVPIDPDAPEANITITSGDGLHAPSDTVQLSYSLASGQVRWATDSSDLIAVDSNGIVSAKPRTAAIEIQPVIIQAQSNGAQPGKITLYVGDYSYDESTSTYHIYSELGLNYWAESENVLTSNVTLERDITLTRPADEKGSNRTGVGNFDNGYNATFDGKNHTISGLQMIKLTNPVDSPQGFFRRVDSNGTIRNLNLTDVDIYIFNGNVGAIAGYSFGTIENCTVSGTRVRGFAGAVGGIAGTTQNGQILNCTNNCAVYCYNQDSTVGGIVGLAWGSTIEGCKNYGNLTSEGAYRIRCGGIAGRLLNSYVDGCTNNGNSTAGNTKSNTNGTSNILTNILYAGGIVGHNEGTGAVTDCTIEDGITIDAYYYSDGLNEEAAVGDIVGKGTEGSGNTGTATITKTDRSNTGSTAS